jgi:hypothetical protein
MRTLITLLALTLAACNTEAADAPAAGEESAVAAKASADVEAARSEAGL